LKQPESETLEKGWLAIRKVFRNSFSSSFHFAIASVNSDGSPHVTPIGSLLLDKATQTGVYFEIFTTQLRRNIETNPNICVLAVNSGIRFWLKSLLFGRFSKAPATRLYGVAGKRREARPTEVQRWKKQTGYLKRFKGYKLLWGNLTHVREVKFHRVESVKMGKMTQGV